MAYDKVHITLPEHSVGVIRSFRDNIIYGNPINVGFNSVDIYSGYDYSIIVYPDSGYRIKHFIVNGVDVSTGYYSGSYLIGVPTDSGIIYTASLEVELVPSVDIVVSVGAHGSTIPPANTISVIPGTNLTVTIIPDNGYGVANVIVDGVSIGAVTSYTFGNVQVAHTISATFADTSRTITATAGANGSISPSGNVTVTAGQNRPFTITPFIGFQIANVLVDGVSVGPVSFYSFYNVQVSHTIAASFSQLNSFIIEASAGANGSISPVGSTIVVQGTNRTFTITPNAYHHIVDVLVDGVSVGAVSPYVFNNVTAAHTISATFAINTFHIVASAGLHGSITPSGEVLVNYNVNQSFSIVPDDDYRVQAVYVDGVAVSIPASGILFIDD